MADICCGVVSGAEAAGEAREGSPPSTRKRKMEVRRFKFVGGVEAMAIPGDFNCKRQKLEFTLPTLPVLSSMESGKEEETESSADSSKTWNLKTSTVARPAGSSGSEILPRYGMTSVIGRRRDMEDAVSICPDFGGRSDRKLHFFGVFDGHGCSHVAVSCKDRMHKIMAEEMEWAAGAAEDWKGVMERSFSRMDAEVVSCHGGEQNASCRCELQAPKCDHVGSTAVVAVVASDCIVVANCGDSRAVLCRKGVPVPLSSDHKPDRPDELDRIQAAGGRVIYWEGARVLGVLAMSRAIGDSYLKPYVVSDPEVTIAERSEDDECLILASDGLWDVVTNEMACDIARMCVWGNTPAQGSSCDSLARQGSDKACSDAAMLLTKLALARYSSDNVSVVVVDLRRNTNW